MRGFRHPLTRRRPQPQRGDRRKPGATPRGPATASYASPERAAQDLRGGCVANVAGLVRPFRAWAGYSCGTPNRRASPWAALVCPVGAQDGPPRDPARRPLSGCSASRASVRPLCGLAASWLFPSACLPERRDQHSRQGETRWGARRDVRSGASDLFVLSEAGVRNSSSRSPGSGLDSVRVLT